MIYSADTVIKESLENLKVFNHKEREHYVHKLLDYYSGNNTANYIADRFDLDAFREVPPYEANITKKFINKMSRIYTVGADRNVSKRYNDMIMLKDSKMKHIERMTRLLGTIAVRIMLKDFDDKKYFDYQPIYYFHPFFGMDPFMPVAITYPLLTKTSDATNTEQMEYIHWNDQEYIIFNENGDILEQQPHGLGVLPFVFTHREHQCDDFYVEGANDIMNANEHINITMTEMQLGLRFQMFGQPIVSGADLGNRQRFGSDVILELPADADYDIKSPAGDIDKVIENVKFQMELVAQNNHLFVQFAQDGGETPSGIALKIKDLERFEDYQDDLALWNLYEHHMYEIERNLARVNGISLPDNLKIDFNEPDYPMTVQDQIALDVHRLNLNLISEPELMVEYNKDLTIEEAELKVAENKQKNRKQSIFSQARQEVEGATGFQPNISEE
tara:strand:+ start:1157 stop:2491 length:1335 start_codon:yes stop_codon:yes gene_type:complete